MSPSHKQTKATTSFNFFSKLNHPVVVTMEAISAITSLLPSIIHGFEYIQLARAFGDDFKLYQARLTIIQLRLSRWGQATGFTPQQQEDKAPPSGGSSESGLPALSINASLSAVEDMLDNVSRVIKKAQAESAKRNPEDVDNECSPALGDNDLTPSRFKRLNRKMQGIVSKRYRKTAEQVEGLKWALYKKEQCESITTQLSGLLDQLEQFVEPQSRLEELTHEDSKSIGESLSTLLEIVGKCDPKLEDAAKQVLEDNSQSTNITMSATNNYGLQLGVNRGTMKGLSFGKNNTISNHWGRDADAQ